MNSSSSSSSSRCAACKHLRRRCPSDCVFAPYFPANDPRRFAYVHRIYGASNVAKILQVIDPSATYFFRRIFDSGFEFWLMLKQGLPVSVRGEAADSLYKEAYYRVMDPVYGVVGMVASLRQQIYTAQCQLARVHADITFAAAAAGSDPAMSMTPALTPAIHFPEQNGGSYSSSSYYDVSSWLN